MASRGMETNGRVSLATYIIHPANDGFEHVTEESWSLNKDANSDKHFQHLSDNL